MNLLNPPYFRYYKNFLHNTAEYGSKESMKETVLEAVEEKEGNQNIAAACDVIWQKRGFSSQMCCYCNQC